MPIFNDNLDGSVGDLLRNRSGWSRPVGADEAQVLSGFTGGFALTLGTTVASSTWHVPTTQPSSADQYVSGLLDTAPQASVFPLGVRCDVSNNLGAGYLLRHGTTGVLQLFRRTSAGNQAQIGSASITVADLVANPVTLKAVGNQISVEFKGATVIGPVTDTTATSGSVAILSRGGVLSTRSMINSWESGEVGAGPTPIAGSLSATLGPLTASGAGSALIGGQASVTLGAVTLNASGAVTITGTANATLGTLTGTATANLPIVGGASATLGSISVAATGAVAITGSASIALGGLSLVATGRQGARQAVRFLQIAARTKRLALTSQPKTRALTARAKRLHFTARADGDNAMERLSTKLADEIWRFELNCANWIPSGAAIASVTGEVISGTATVQDFEVATAPKVTCMVSGGDPGTTTTFRVLVTMNDGQIFGDDFSVYVA